MSALSLRGVHKRFGKVHALNDLSLDVPAGVICGLVGPNGAGKTTTFGVVGGLVKPDQGSIEVLGAGPFDALVHAGRVTLLPQDCQPSPHVPARAMLVFYAELQGLSRADARREADRVLELVDLVDKAGARVRQLSHGMKRRLTVAQALLGEPELVLLDEPTAGLDPDQVVRLRQVLRDQAGHRTLIISSHVLSELEATCDWVALMDAGACTASGPMDEITGRRSRVRVVLGAPLGELPQVAGVRVTQESATVLVADAVDDVDPAELNRRVLGALLAADAAILEVQRGRSLEAAWLQRGGAD